MKLADLMHKLEYTCDDLYGTQDLQYIIRYTGERDGYGGQFMVLRYLDYKWLTGIIWLPFGSDTFLVEHTVDSFVTRSYFWLRVHIQEDDGSDWDDWDIYSPETFAELCHDCYHRIKVTFRFN